MARNAHSIRDSAKTYEERRGRQMQREKFVLNWKRSDALEAQTGDHAEESRAWGDLVV